MMRRLLLCFAMACAYTDIVCNLTDSDVMTRQDGVKYVTLVTYETENQMGSVLLRQADTYCLKDATSVVSRTNVLVLCYECEDEAEFARRKADAKRRADEEMHDMKVTSIVGASITCLLVLLIVALYRSDQADKRKYKAEAEAKRAETNESATAKPA